MKQVLFVEDNPTYLEILMWMIRREYADIRFWTAADLEIALDLCLTRKFDLVIMDIMLPTIRNDIKENQEGLVLASWVHKATPRKGCGAPRPLRRRSPNRTTPLLMLTSRSAANVQEEALDYGLNPVLLKNTQIEKNLKGKTEAVIERTADRSAILKAVRVMLG